LTVRRTADGRAWEFVHPRCAVERSDDMEEVEAMVAGGEHEIAEEELRWLLAGCAEFMEGHVALGEIAALDEDWKLARGHFGAAFRLGCDALDRAKARGPVPYKLAANQVWYEAGKGLILALIKLDKRDLAAEVRDRLLQGDPSDPLAIGQLMPTSSPPSPST
jgi:hypothetical protein